MRCSALQCVAVCCSVLQCVVVCCSVLQCVAVCYSVLQCVRAPFRLFSELQCVALCFSVLQCVQALFGLFRFRISRVLLRIHWTIFTLFLEFTGLFPLFFLRIACFKR